MTNKRVPILGILALLAAGCGSSSSPGGAGSNDAATDAPTDAHAEAAAQDAAPDADATLADAGMDADADAGSDADTDAAPTDGAVSCDDKAKSCASTFGSLFTKSDGRADGTLVALVRPVDQQCALPNGTHVTLQLSIAGQVQRLVTSVNGVAVTTASAPLVGPAYAEGWHQNVVLDYPTDLGVHSGDFTSVTLDEGVAFLCSHLQIGAPVSVYAYSDGSEPSSAHQIHRNDNYPDGAIVVDPTSPDPTYLLFRYATQTF